MKDFWLLYLVFGAITIPLTIFLIVSLVKELLDLLLNKKSVDELLHRADNLTLDKFEKNYETYANAFQPSDEWTREQLLTLSKRKELEEKLRKAYYKRDQSAIRIEIRNLEIALRDFERKYLATKFGEVKSPHEIDLENRVKKIFSPQ